MAPATSNDGPSPSPAVPPDLARPARFLREDALDDVMQAYAAGSCADARAGLGRAVSGAFPLLPGNRDALARRRRGFTPAEAALLRDDAQGLEQLRRAGVALDWPLPCVVDAAIAWRLVAVLPWLLRRCAAEEPAETTAAAYRAVLAVGDPDLARAAFAVLRDGSGGAAMCGAAGSLLYDDPEPVSSEDGDARPPRLARHAVALAALQAAWLGSARDHWERVDPP